MSIKILEKYIEVCKVYGFNPNWEDLKKFREVF